MDAERTRELLLEAALEEFAARGFAGARVRDIAARAGVSKDLIAYHFGGKDGLYRAVQQSWLGRQDSAADPTASLADSFARHLREALTDARPMRLLVWRGLAAEGAAPPLLDDPRSHPDVERLRRRQQDGELPADIDPAALQLLLLGAAAAPVVFPDIARRLFGVEPTDPAFERRYRAGLARLCPALAGVTDPEESP